MSETLAYVDWMDFHARKTLPERVHTLILFHDLHISQICLCMHSHRNKHTFRKHLICWKLHTCRHGAAALYSEAACSLDITHLWEQKPDTLLCLLLAYFCFCFSSAVKLNSLACSLGNNQLEFTAAIMPFSLERWPPLQLWWISGRLSATSIPAVNDNNILQCIVTFVDVFFWLKQFVRIRNQKQVNK